MRSKVKVEANTKVESTPFIVKSEYVWNINICE